MLLSPEFFLCASYLVLRTIYLVFLSFFLFSLALILSRNSASKGQRTAEHHRTKRAGLSCDPNWAQLQSWRFPWYSTVYSTYSPLSGCSRSFSLYTWHVRTLFFILMLHLMFWKASVKVLGPICEIALQNTHLVDDFGSTFGLVNHLASLSFWWRRVASDF